MAVESGIPLSSLWRLCKRVGGRKHKRWVKPVMSDKQKFDRVGFASSHMHRGGGTGVVVDNMYDRGHVDEKWVYVTKDGRGIYLHPEGDAPKPPTAQNKRFIKVMFLAVVASPRMISDGVWLDGKIGIWPIADAMAAMRSSKNRKKGTMMLKPAIVNAERYKELMIDKVIPAIKARMPRPPGHTIFVQQGGAKPHTWGGVMEAIQAKAGDSIILETHPANLPDLNVNDLGFFHSIQQLKEVWECLLPSIWWRPQWRPSMSTPRRHQNESGRACSLSLGKSLALRVIIATSCPIWARRISVGQANFRSTGGWMRKNTMLEGVLGGFGREGNSLAWTVPLIMRVSETTSLGLCKALINNEITPTNLPCALGCPVNLYFQYEAEEVL
ncbi:unnamed protein product [Discosporangium mesarthrocarpum]